MRNRLRESNSVTDPQQENKKGYEKDDRKQLVKTNREIKHSFQGLMDEAEAEQDERKELSMSSPSYTFLSGSPLCCRSGRLIAGKCVCVFRSRCVWMPHVPWVWGPQGVDRLSVKMPGGGFPLSIFLPLSFSTVTRWLTSSCTAQGHCNTAKVWKVHDTRSSTVSQRF